MQDYSYLMKAVCKRLVVHRISYRLSEVRCLCIDEMLMCSCNKAQSKATLGTRLVSKMQQALQENCNWAS